MENVRRLHRTGSRAPLLCAAPDITPDFRIYPISLETGRHAAA
jgi:hypothetical protein